MNKKSILWIILICAIIAAVSIVLLLKHSSAVKELPELPAEVQNEQTETEIIKDDNKEESKDDIKAEEQKDIKPAVVKQSFSKSQEKAKPIKEKETSLVKTVVEGSTIRIVTPESKPRTVEVPPSEPRTDIVDVKYEYRTKTPRKYIFK